MFMERESGPNDSGESRPKAFSWGPLSEEDARAAEEHLRNLPGFNYEAWKNRENPQKLFAGRLGPKEDCIPISTFVAIQDALAHVQRCEACRNECARLQEMLDRARKSSDNRTD